MRHRVTLTLSSQTARLLDGWSRKLGQTRSRTAEELIREGGRRRRQRSLEKMAAEFFQSDTGHKTASTEEGWDRLSLEALADDE